MGVWPTWEASGAGSRGAHLSEFPTLGPDAPAPGLLDSWGQWSRSLLAHPSDAAWPGSPPPPPPPPPREPPGRGRGGEGVCGAGGEGAERRGRERRSERASERTSGAFLRSSGASWSPPGRPLDERTERQTDSSRKPRRRRQVSRARRPRRLSLRPEPRVLEDVRGRSRSYDSCLCWYVCRGVHISGCVLNVNARVPVDRCKWRVRACASE